MFFALEDPKLRPLPDDCQIAIVQLADERFIGLWTSYNRARVLRHLEQVTSRQRTLPWRWIASPQGNGACIYYAWNPELGDTAFSSRELDALLTLLWEQDSVARFSPATAAAISDNQQALPAELPSAPFTTLLEGAQSWPILMQQAQALLRAGRYEEAITYARRAVSSSPSVAASIQAEVLVGVIAVAADRIDEAVDTFRAAAFPGYVADPGLPRDLLATPYVR